MVSVFGRPGNTAFIARHYRGIVYGLVLVNSALIVFLIVFVWTYGLESRNTRSLGASGVSPGQPLERFVTGTVQADKLSVWSKAGGRAVGAQSLGVIEKGKSVKVLRSVEAGSGLWLEVAFGELTGWVPVEGIRPDRLAP